MHLIKLKDAPKGYKHLEKFVFEVICGPMTETYRERETWGEKRVLEGKYPVHLLRVVSVGGFSLPFETDARTKRQIQEGCEPVHVSKNPTRYDKNNECLIGMTLHLNLDNFTVLSAGEK